MDSYTRSQLQNADELNGRSVRATVERLSTIWNEMGFDVREREERIGMVCHHIRALTEKMVQEEEMVLNQVKDDIADWERQIDLLNDELGNVAYTYNGPSEVLKREKILSTELKRLNGDKDTRMVELFELKTREQELCNKLLQPQAFVSSDRIPTTLDLNLIRESIKRLENLKYERWEEFTNLKRDICQSYDLIGETPTETFTRDIITEEADSFIALNPDTLDELRTNKFTLDQRKEQRTIEKDYYANQILLLSRRLKKSEEYMANVQKHDLSEKWIHALKTELEKLQIEKFAKLKDLVQSCREEIANIWDRMYFSQEQREHFNDFYTEEYSEEMLTSHEEECARLNTNYQDHKNMFDGVDQWSALFNTYRSMRDREKDPNRFKNNGRGGGLLKQQKEMAALKKKLPILEQQLIDDIVEWEKEHERTFLVDGVGFIQYIQSQWAAISENERIEKTERSQKKRHQLAVDMVYGTVTPTKKRVAFGSTQNLTNMSKRSRIDASVISTVSKLQKIPAFSRLASQKKQPESPTPSNAGFQQKRLRRRSKSANNLLAPTLLGSVRTKITNKLNQFRTPQPVQRKGSRLPARVCKTEKKPKMHADFQREFKPIMEDFDKENSIADFEVPTDIPPYGHGGPTSIKSAPVFEDAGPLSYDDFGSGIDKRHARSSAIGTFGFNGVSYEH